MDFCVEIFMIVHQEKGLARRRPPADWRSWGLPAAMTTGAFITSNESLPPAR
jgi:hypothetical protein